MKRWNVNDMKPGDFLRVQIENKRGDRNLDGAILSGVIQRVVPSHDMVQLESGWCCHTKDRLLEHRPAVGATPTQEH